MAKKEEVVDTESTEQTEAHSLSFDYEGTTYTMEFNRRTVEFMERQKGINIVGLITGTKIEMTALPEIFRCSLMMHHPKMKESTADGLFALMSDKTELFNALIELIARAVNTTYEEPQEGKAISWSRH